MKVKRESKLASVVLALAVVAFLPGLIIGAALGDNAGIAVAYGSLGVLMMTFSARPRTVLLCAIPYGIAASLVSVSADRPMLAFVVMGVTTALCASTARYGLAASFTLMPIMLGFLLAQPLELQDGHSQLWVGVGVAFGAAWMAIVNWILTERMHLPKIPHGKPTRAALYAIVLGLVVGGASALIVANQWGHGGAWFLMTIILVVQPYLPDSWHKSVQRGIGTVIGVVIAVVLAALIPWSWLVYVVAVLFIFLAVRNHLQPHRPYWQFVMFLTPSIVLFEGESTSVNDLAGSRLIATFGAVALGLLLVVILKPFVQKPEPVKA